ncbi:hypothetical protein GCM10025865_28430 [Paraoerskovia sediminicola]|uniref:N-acetyltransferase domain-containing protein n=1 Tax=Paraoerskovia sediminicola TaxID=1138587 RepID=A0ABN6XFB1_9CELL|nr:GNAT family N-acetyltransferase [Paraoerskovia sediminicola]BDZ43544.1 hypothetical protein GCM10025865_28430 [Paraoerskovia sediminicola]
MRSTIAVRPVDGSELSVLARISAEARDESAVGSQVCGPDDATIVRQLSVLLAMDGGNILVALDGDEIVGFVLCRVVRPTVFDVTPAMHIEALYVSEAARRRGAGHALLSGVADLAQVRGAVDVYSVPIPGARGVQRFLARLGFAPVAGHRVVATATLRRRLNGDSGQRRRGSRSLEDLIARRRRARTEGASGPLDLREFQKSIAAVDADAAEISRSQGTGKVAAG